MRFLIDECLSIDLVSVADQARTPGSHPLRRPSTVASVHLAPGETAGRTSRLPFGGGVYPPLTWLPSDVLCTNIFVQERWLFCPSGYLRRSETG